MKKLLTLSTLLLKNYCSSQNVITFNRPSSTRTNNSPSSSKISSPNWPIGFKPNRKIIGNTRTNKNYKKDSMCNPENTFYYNQKVDHFNFKNKNTFKQKFIYWEPENCCKNNGLLLYTGNEGDIDTFCENDVLQYEIAKKNNYAVLYVEHRYYGESYPENKTRTKGSRSDSDYFQYLSVQQALADYIQILTTDQEKTPKIAKSSPKVVAFGGSYGGMLSAYIRYKYPNIIKGAIAGSAPVAITSVSDHDCSNFNKVVTETFNYYENCGQKVRKSWDFLNDMTDDEIALKFNLCDAVGPDSGLEPTHLKPRLINSLIENYVMMAMMNYDHAANFMMPLPAWPVEYFCGKISNFKNDEFKDFHLIEEALQLSFNFTGDCEKCIDIGISGSSNSFTPKFSKSSNLKSNLNIDMASWYYQTCTQIPIILCSSKLDMFPNSTFESPNKEYAALKTQFIKGCQENVSVEPDFNYLKSFMSYFQDGGESPSTEFSNIIFTNGQFDPWKAGKPNLSENLEKDIILIDIEKGAHHAELMPVFDEDPISFYKARMQIESFVNKWISGA